MTTPSAILRAGAKGTPPTKKRSYAGHTMTELEKVACAFAETAAAYKADALALARRLVALKHPEPCECGECQMINVTAAALRAPSVLPRLSERRGWRGGGR